MFLLYIDMNLTVAIYTAILFFVLSPNVLLRLPPNGSKLVVAGVHALVFAVVLYLTQKLVWQLSVGLEGMNPTITEGARSRKKKRK